MPIPFKQGMTAQTYDASVGQVTGTLGLNGQLNFFNQPIGSGGIPVAVAPTGSLNTVGAITLGTALPRIYPAIWLYLPANAVVGDATGGLYFAIMSSTTVGVVYAGKQGVANGVNTAALPFQPFYPTSLVAATTTNGAYTGSTTETYLVNVTLPAQSLGLQGQVRITVNQTTNNTVGAKTFRTTLNTTTIGQTGSYTTSTGGTQMIALRNNGSQAFNSSQVVGGVATGAAVYTAIDTSVAAFIGLANTSAVATDVAVIEGYSIEVIPKD
jgi:hypothetical protein